MARFIRRPLSPDPTIAGQFFLSSGRGEILQRGVRVVEACGRIVELKPVLDLVQITVRVVREPLINEVRVGLLCIFEHPSALDPVHIHADEAAIVKGDVQLVQHPKGRLFSLRGVVVVEVANGRQHGVGIAEEWIVRWKVQDIITKIICRAAPPAHMERTAAVE